MEMDFELKLMKVYHFPFQISIKIMYVLNNTSYAHIN
jgi:hypothetical protein